MGGITASSWSIDTSDAAGTPNHAVGNIWRRAHPRPQYLFRRRRGFGHQRRCALAHHHSGTPRRAFCNSSDRFLYTLQLPMGFDSSRPTLVFWVHVHPPVAILRQGCPNNPRTPYISNATITNLTVPSSPSIPHLGRIPRKPQCQAARSVDDARSNLPIAGDLCCGHSRPS